MVMASFPMPENMSLYVEKATLLMWDKNFKMGSLSYIILVDPVIRILFKEARKQKKVRVRERVENPVLLTLKKEKWSHNPRNSRQSLEAG